jgi:hypothetical protein
VTARAGFREGVGARACTKWCTQSGGSRLYGRFLNPIYSYLCLVIWLPLSAESSFARASFVVRPQPEPRGARTMLTNRATGTRCAAASDIYFAKSMLTQLRARVLTSLGVVCMRSQHSEHRAWTRLRVPLQSSEMLCRLLPARRSGVARCAVNEGMRGGLRIHC